jgi:hypothetical protein
MLARWGSVALLPPPLACFADLKSSLIVHCVACTEALACARADLERCFPHRPSPAQVALPREDRQCSWTPAHCTLYTSSALPVPALLSHRDVARHCPPLRRWTA